MQSIKPRFAKSNNLNDSDMIDSSSSSRLDLSSRYNYSETVSGKINKGASNNSSIMIDKDRQLSAVSARSPLDHSMRSNF
jgi:hypothetical protein